MVQIASIHPLITRSWLEWEFDGTEKRTILVVETEAPLGPEEANFSPGLIEELRLASIAILRTSASAIDGIRIVPVRY